MGINTRKTLLITCPQASGLHNAVDYLDNNVDKWKNLNQNSSFINLAKYGILPKYVWRDRLLDSTKPIIKK